MNNKTPDSKTCSQFTKPRSESKAVSWTKDKESEQYELNRLRNYWSKEKGWHTTKEEDTKNEEDRNARQPKQQN